MPGIDLRRLDPGKYRRLLVGLGLGQLVFVGLVVAIGLMTTRSYEQLIDRTRTAQQAAVVSAAVERLLWQDHVAHVARVAAEIGREIQAAVAADDRAELTAALAEVHRRGAFSSGEIALVGVTVHGLDGAVLAQVWPGRPGGTGTAAFAGAMAGREGGDRLRPHVEASAPGGLPLLSVGSPVGGLRLVGYVALHVDPLTALAGLDRRVATPVHFEEVGGAVLKRLDGVTLPDEAPVATSRVPVAAPDGTPVFAAVVTLDNTALRAGLGASAQQSLLGILGVGGAVALALVAAVWAYLLRAHRRESELSAQVAAAKAADAEARALAEAAHAAQEAQQAREIARQARVVQDLEAGLRRLADGDLTHAIESPADDPFPEEYEALRSAYNEALARLSAVMTQIAAVAQSVRTGATEIAEASSSLSSRTETQAATLEQSSAALNELSESVRQTAESAGAAEQAGRSNFAEARTGEQIVREAISAMKAIERSAGQITRIIAVIDDIAFQTNLLALNAGVEAARAGDAGRGFAVVASEVRALAQRASESARDINGLISESGAHVQAGADLVLRTGESLERILAQASEVSRLMGEIATAASEQASALSEINGGVSQLDQVTQENAAAAEEATAASAALSEQASDLAMELAAFRIAQGSAAGASPPPRAAPYPVRAVAGGW